MTSALHLASARFSKLQIPFINHLLHGDLYKKSFLVSIFFSYQSKFIMYIDFTHIAALKTVTDNVSN